MKIKRNCLFCGEEFFSSKYRINRGGGKYCSQKCYFSRPNKRTKAILKTCIVCGKEFYALPSRLKRGWSKCCSKECLYEYLKTNGTWNKGKPNPKNAGSRNGSWKGGISPINSRIRHSVEYKLWRTAIFLRDDYTCQLCGKRGYKLQADHIKPFSIFPELRFAIDNGRTLCLDCHTKTDTWGYKNQENTERAYLAIRK